VRAAPSVALMEKEKRDMAKAHSRAAAAWNLDSHAWSFYMTSHRRWS
jgi:hypothetical protein